MECSTSSTDTSTIQQESKLGRKIEIGRKSTKDTGSTQFESEFYGVTDDQLEACWRDHRYHIHGVHSNDSYAEEQTMASFGSCDSTIFGFSCIKGSKSQGDQGPNQDNLSITIFDDDWSVFCVADGHGRDGHHVSTRVVRVLPYYFVQSRNFPGDIQAALFDAFEFTEKDLTDYADTRFDFAFSGASCVVYVRAPERTRAWTASLGDARVVLGAKIGVRHSTVEHKPSDSAERRRITEAGGTVIREGAGFPYRVFLADEKYPGLGMSRCFGNEIGKRCGISAEPEITELELQEGDYMVLGSDGIWDVVSSDAMVGMINSKLSTYGLNAFARKVTKKARHMWRREAMEYCDDITVLLVL